MPIYEYQCQNCGHQLEKLQKLTDAPLVHCPECQTDSLTKLVSKAGFRLKGGGWYETDFKTDKDKKRNLAGSEETGGSSNTSANTDSGKSSTSSTESNTSTPSSTSEK